MATAYDLRCSGTCCRGHKKLAQIYSGSGLEVVSRQHGTLHTAFLSAGELIYLLSGSSDSTGITNWVRSVIS